jgi:DNA-binding NtrC family response regulator
MKTLKQIEKELIMNRLAANEGNRTITAQELGFSVRTLHRRLKKYGYGDEGGNNSSSMGA